MPPAKAIAQEHKNKLANSYSELLQEFSSKDLRHVGNYTLGKFIGKGSFGKVYLAKHNLTNGSKVVLKSSKKDDANLAREIHHHRQFVHPHIARLYEVIVTENLVWLVLEYCPGDELYNYLLRTGALPVDKVQKIFTQLLGAVAYIHNHNCVHRDLKLENVLLDKNENVKLCDFGFTREYEGKSNYLQTFCGTVCYSAPEMLRGEKYAGEKVDVWSLGVILYALLKGALPFDEDDDQVTKVKILKEEPIYPDDFPDAAKSLISKLLSKRPLFRPALADILTDPFLADYAPQQQSILKLTRPAPFTTALEKITLERMKSAGVDIDQVIENVLSQRCDALAGWWTLLIEKEERKEQRREKKRREREAELKVLRRLSGASSRLDRLASTLGSVDEEGRRPSSADRPRSGSRGRTQRRSTHLPLLPEGSAVVSPGTATPPPPPIEKDSTRSRSVSRPSLPPKERRRRSSTLQVVTNNPDFLGPSNGVTKRRVKKRYNNQFLNQLTAIKHWIVESAKRGKSPATQPISADDEKTSPNSALPARIQPPSPIPTQGHQRDTSNATVATYSSYGAAITPTSSQVSGANGHAGGLRQSTVDTSRTRRHRSSLSPSPLTPRAAYRRSSGGLRGRKSTSSSVSSIRSMPRHASHSKASSTSSNSIDNVHSPGSKSASGRSPHHSIKVLPVTPTSTHFSSNIRVVRNPTPTSSASAVNDTSTGSTPLDGNLVDPLPSLFQPHTSSVMFGRRKKSPFKGPGPPLLSTGFFGSHILPGQGSPAFPAFRLRDGNDGKLGLGLRDSAKGKKGSVSRKSQVIEEEEEDGRNGLGVMEEADEEEIEEVDVFSPVEADLGRGERVHSVVIWDEDGETVEKEEGTYAGTEIRA